MRGEQGWFGSTYRQMVLLRFRVQLERQVLLGPFILPSSHY